MTDNAEGLDVELGDSAPGTARPPKPVVFVRREALAAVEAHAQEDLDRELGGVLVGAAASSAEGTLVSIEAAIRAKHTDAARGSITFTHETWEHINQVKDREHPDKRIVGWYHTHPGFGLFLSEHDLFIHRNFFRVPWQIAMVLDPRANETGMFVWRGDDVTGPEGFELVVPQAPSPVAPTPPAPAPDKAGGAWRWVLLALVAAILVFLGVEFARSFAPAVQQEIVATGPASTSREVAALRDRVAALMEAARGRAVSAGSPYTVQRGDSLWRIAEENYGDGAKWPLIAATNSIAPDDIDAGMVLWIPQLPAPEDGQSGDQ